MNHLLLADNVRPNAGLPPKGADNNVFFVTE